MGPWPTTPGTVRAFFAARDLPCHRCGYNLRDLQTEVCPECGWKVELADYWHRDPLPRDWMVAFLPAALILLGLAVPLAAGMVLPRTVGVPRLALALPFIVGAGAWAVHAYRRPWLYHQLSPPARAALWVCVVGPGLALALAPVVGMVAVAAWLVFR